MLIINAKIFTLENFVINNGFIYIKDGKFNKIGEMQNLDVFDKNTVDLCGKNVYPGFVDAHTHMGLFENGLTFEGDDGNEATDPVTPQLRALDAINPMDRSFAEAAEAGVTTVVVSPGSANAIAGEVLAMKTVGQCVDEMLVKSPIAIKFALGENPKTVYNGKEEAPMTRMATAALIREQLQKAKIYMEAKVRAEEASDVDAMPEYSAKAEALVPLLQRKVQAHFHVHRADDIFTALRIATEFGLDAALVHATEGYLVKKILKEKNISVLSGPIIADRSKPELSNFYIKSTAELCNNNILSATITDHPEVPIQHLPLCAMLAVKAGMSEDDALKSITINPAKICKIDDRVGSIAPGKDADLVVYETSPLDFYAEPLLVICGGKVVVNRL